MSVKRRGKIYHYAFKLGGLRFRGSTRETEKGAAKNVEAAARLKARTAATAADGPGELTLNQAAERFYQEKAQHWKSAKTAEGQLATLVRLIGRSTRLSAIDGARVAAFVAARRGERSQHADPAHKASCRCERCALAPATVNREIELLGRLLRRADEVWNVRLARPRPRISTEKLPEPAGRVRELTDEEETALLAGLRDDLVNFYVFSERAGCRKSESVLLTWPQVDFRNRVIRLKTKSRKPGGKPHVIPMDDVMEQILREELGRHPMQVFTYVTRRGGHTDRSKIRRRKGQRYPLTVQGWNKEWRKAIAAAGIEDFRFHDVRHTRASRLLRDCRNLKMVQDLLGHKDINTTARYAHVLVDDLRAAMNRTLRPGATKRATGTDGGGQ